MNVTKNPNDPMTYLFAALLYFMTKIPSDQKTKWRNDFVFLIWNKVSFLILMNVTKKPNDPMTYLFAALLYFMNKIPSDQNTKWPNDFVFLIWN